MRWRKSGFACVPWPVGPPDQGRFAGNWSGFLATGYDAAMARDTVQQTGHSDATTRGIRIRVGAMYLPEQSDRQIGRYLFAYRVLISNEGDYPAKLIARHWIIRDADNEVEEVRGPGVVGEQPHLKPGDLFEYSSGCPLTTTWGTMEGSYTMELEDGSTFEAEIGRFFLAPNTGPLGIL